MRILLTMIGVACLIIFASEVYAQENWRNSFKNATPEQRQKFKQKMQQRFKNATPQQREKKFKNMLERMPPQFRNIAHDMEAKKREIKKLPPRKRREAIRKYRAEIKKRFLSAANTKWQNASASKKDLFCRRVTQRCKNVGAKRKNICDNFIYKCNNR